LRPSTPLKSEILQSQKFAWGHPPLSTTYVATFRDLILRCWEFGATATALVVVVVDGALESPGVLSTSGVARSGVEGPPR
jgi:hypothetical protein